MRITLPWPDRKLSPNASVSWKGKIRPKLKANSIGFYAAREQYIPGESIPFVGNLRVTYHIYPPDKRHYDDDNIIASLKSYRDGIAIGLEVDDNCFRMADPVWHEPIKGGQIIVEIEEI